MLLLHMLAGPAIEGPDAERSRRVLRQPKLLALLFYLAHERRFVSRFSLLGLFWPELDELRGRAALRKAIFLIRRDLGDVLVSRGNNEVGIDASILRCDTSEFLDALQAGDRIRALHLYRGDLLPGFYIAGAFEFERWLDAQRSRLRTAAEKASVSLAQAALEGDDLEGALRWGRRTREISRHSEEGAFHVINALCALNDHAKALDTYRRYAAQLDADYAIQPSPRIERLVASIRSPLPDAAAAGAAMQNGAGGPGGVGPSGNAAERYRRFFQSATDVMYETDELGRFTDVNEAATRVLGYPREELIGRLYLELIREDYRDAILAFYLRQLEERTPSTYNEFPALRADGSVVWLGQNAQLVVEAGEVVGVQAVARDVGPQMRMAEAQRNFALRDHVTDLYGPRGFHCMAEDRIKLAMRTDRKLILLVLDVDEVGGAVTAPVLPLAARLLESTFRATDVVARTGDHRFAVLALESPEADDQAWTATVAGRLRATAREQEWPAELALTVGIAFSAEAAGCDAQQLLSKCAMELTGSSIRVLPAGITRSGQAGGGTSPLEGARGNRPAMRAV